MRRKNDVLIKYFQLANTMFLTNEEFGALVRKIIIEDDADEIRYENLDGETAFFLQTAEERWEQEYDALLKKNPLIISAKASLSHQVNNSTRAFQALRERLENKNLDGTTDGDAAVDLGDPAKQVHTKFDITVGGQVFSFDPTGVTHLANFPRKADLEKFLASLSCDDETKIEILDYICQMGAPDRWQVHWRKLAREAHEQLTA